MVKKKFHGWQFWKSGIGFECVQIQMLPKQLYPFMEYLKERDTEGDPVYVQVEVVFSDQVQMGSEYDDGLLGICLEPIEGCEKGFKEHALGLVNDYLNS
jgi:hypothetical protein